MLERGDIVDGRYRVERELGEGGMGTVFLVTHVDLHSQHALKVLAGELFFKRGMRDRFLQEGRVMAGLQHPNIVRVTDIVSTNLAGLVMEYIEGPTLDEWIDANGAQDLAACRRIMLPLLGAVGMAHSHENRIIHRDLKPENIILASGPSGEQRPVILDFGIAKLLGNDDKGGKIRTGTGTGMGTPGYMAPEQIKNAKNADERSDIYSLGVVLYELATGEPAFTGESEFEIGMAVVQGRSKGLPADLDPVLRSCIQKATQLDPARRFHGCSEFAKAINQKKVATEVIRRAVPPPQPKPPPGRESKPDVKPPAPPPPPSHEPAEDVAREWEEEKRRGSVGGLLAAGGLGGMALFGVLALGCMGLGIAVLSSDDNSRPVTSGPSSSPAPSPPRGSSPITTESTPAMVAAPTKDPSKSESTGMRFELVQSGEFTMGSPSGEANRQSDEQQRKVIIGDDLWVGRYEVTQDEFRVVMGRNPSASSGNRKPVTNIDWYEAVSFCNELSRLDGYEPVYAINGTRVTADWTANGYRLPTAAEWEFAARSGGSETTTWAGGSSPSAVAWTKENSGGRPRDVGGKRANAAGLHDMSGNVYEWVWDWNVCAWNTNTCDVQSSRSGSSKNPQGPISGASKVHKGGAFKYESKYARIANHAYDRQAVAFDYVGFRVVRLAD